MKCDYENGVVAEKNEIDDIQIEQQNTASNEKNKDLARFKFGKKVIEI